MDRCAVECPMPTDNPTGPADYVINDSLEQIVIVIEAKRATFNLGGEPSSLESKLLGYTKGMDIGVAVLTNGLIWRLYELNSARRTLSDRITEKVDIRSDYGDVAESARSLHDWLSRDHWW